MPLFPFFNSLLKESLKKIIKFMKLKELIMRAQDPPASRNVVPTPTDTLAGIKSII